VNNNESIENNAPPNTHKLQGQADILRQCLRAAFQRNDPWTACWYRRRLSEAERALAEPSQARIAGVAEQAAFENAINPS
jgi:hypothetical protein